MFPYEIECKEACLIDINLTFYLFIYKNSVISFVSSKQHCAASPTPVRSLRATLCS